MTLYRLTLRHGQPGKRYHIADFEASNLREALMQAVNAFPVDADKTADLLELRVHVHPDERGYNAG